jgi:CBS domain-containing protein
MTYGSEYLQQIHDQLESGSNCWRKGENLLGAFGYTRRRQTAVDLINTELTRLGLRTVPPIDRDMPLDRYIVFYLAPAVAAAEDETAISTPLPPPSPPEGEEEEELLAVVTADDQAEQIATHGPSPTDLTFTVANLDAAERKPVCVQTGDSLKHAITLMEMHNYSQLVVCDSIGVVKGLISYKSITRTRLHREPELVADCYERVTVVDRDAPLFDVVGRFRTEDAVIVQDSDHVPVGIITPADIALEYGAMTGPFLQIGEIENLLRWMIRKASLSSALDGLEDVDNLTLGRVERELARTDIWDRLNLNYDREVFHKGLDAVRESRNAIMHFRDPLTDDQLEHLQSFARLLKQVCLGMQSVEAS